SEMGEDGIERNCVVEPDAVGHNLVKAAAQLGGAAAEGEEEFGIQKRLAAGEAEDADPIAIGVLQKSHGHVDLESVGPFDRHATVGTHEVALIGAGKGEVVGAESPRSPPDRTRV